MKIHIKPLAINSLMIILSSTIIAILTHEIAHFCLAKYYKLSPIIFNNYVKIIKIGTEAQQVKVAAIGPIFSLFIGALIILTAINNKKPSLLKLFLLWLGMSNILLFLGYILIAPFIKNGDLGKVFHYLKLPTWLTILLAILTFVIMRKLFTKLATQFTHYTYHVNSSTKENIVQIFIYPLIISIALMLAISTPIKHPINVLPLIFMPMAYISTIKKYKSLTLKENYLLIDKISIPLLLISFSLIVLYIFLK